MPLRTFGRHHGQKNLESSTDARGTCTKVNHPVRHRSNDSLVTVLTSRSSTADTTQHTTAIPCGLCFNLMTKTKGSRTSQQCHRGPSIQSTCPNPKESRPTGSLWRNHPQEACHRFGNECPMPDLTHNLRDNFGLWTQSPTTLHSQSETTMRRVGQGVGGRDGAGVVMSAFIDQPFSRPAPSEQWACVGIEP